MKLILINTTVQELHFYIDKQLQFTKKISTARNGLGEQEGSERTPRGWHQISAKIGEDAPLNAIFQARQWTGEIYTPALAQQYPDRDWILARILWLVGLEPGFNQGGCVDSKNRYIYIHGTPDNNTMGIPLSHGCIRMKPHDIIDIFQQVDLETRVFIG